MKKLSTYLFLLLFSFSATSFADDIQDFQIEGMSIGDSLLDYFSEEKIKSNSRKFGKKYYTFEIEESNELKQYDSLMVGYENNDEKYIVAILGGTSFKQINKCHKEMDKIILELSNLFEKKFDKKTTHKHSDPTKANVKITSAELYFDNYDKVLIGCVEQKEKSHTLDISLRKKKFTDYINNEAYK